MRFEIYRVRSSWSLPARTSSWEDNMASSNPAIDRILIGLAENDCVVKKAPNLNRRARIEGD